MTRKFIPSQKMRKILFMTVLTVWILDLCLFSSLMAYLVSESDHIPVAHSTVTRSNIYLFTNTPYPTSTTAYTATLLPTTTPFVLEPVIVPTKSRPAGTSGKCVDGTYTNSENRRGACSYHGGIAEWWGK